MAKKAEAKKEEVKMFYANKDKYERAVLMVEAGSFKKVVDAYKAIGGLLVAGSGYKEV
jgi:hypothetical protein